MNKAYKIILLLFLTLALAIGNAGIVEAQSFTFTAAGDYGNSTTGTGNAANTFTNIAGINPAFHLALGDLAYSASEQSWCTNLKAKYNNLLLVSGNHDSGESSAGNINTYATFCPFTLTVPFVGTYAKQYYFDYPASNPIARMVMIVPGLGGSFVGFDTNYSIGHQGYIFVQNAITDARARGIKWIVVGFHKNYISAMEKSNEIGTDLMKLFLAQRVDLVLQGHEHGYERTKQLTTNSTTCVTLGTGSYNANCVVDSDNNFVKGAGTIIDVLGTGGQSFRALSTSDSEYPYFAVANNSANNFGVGKFTVTSTQILYTYVKNNSAGNLSDSFSITDPQTGHCQPLGDINCDGRINAFDFSKLISVFNTSNAAADLDDSGVVNAADIVILLRAWP